MLYDQERPGGRGGFGAGPIPRHLLPQTATADQSGRLSIGGVDVLTLAEQHGTPLFVYDEADLRSRCKEAVDSFGDGAIYASKAFLCKAMARLVEEEGMRMDVASGGELHVALAAGFPADRMVFHGNNKSSTELETALKAGVGRIVVDSFDELDRIDYLVESGLDRPNVLVRVTPGVLATTHQFVQTGQDDSKFGFTASSGAAHEAIERIQRSRTARVAGIHAHIGSQVFDLDNFSRAVRVIAEFAREFRLPELCVGGGLGVPYVEGEPSISISAWADVIWDVVNETKLRVRLSAEPGRAIVAGAAMTLYEVGTIKEIPGVRTYLSVDGGMSDNPRPVLYGSGYEAFAPAVAGADRDRQVTIVGKHCETGDLLVNNAWIPSSVETGDIIATPVTGAYGHSMGSNYNKLLRPKVVFVADGEARVVVRRETFDDLLTTDVG